MKKIVLLFFGVVASLTIAQSINASVIWDEEFSYSPDGSLTTVSGGNWTAFSGGGTLPIQDVGGVITMTNVSSGTSGEDLRRALDQTYTTGSLYVSLAVSLTVAPTTANGDYFASIYSTAGSGGGYETRIFASTTATGWTFGLSPSGTAPTDWGTDLSLNTYYNIVLKFDIDTKAVSMGVFSIGSGPSSDSDLTLTGTSTATAGPDAFALRQGGSTVMLENIDSIIVGTSLADVVPVPEPSTLALAALGGAACLVGFRRKR